MFHTAPRLYAGRCYAYRHLLHYPQLPCLAISRITINHLSAHSSIKGEPKLDVDEVLITKEPGPAEIDHQSCEIELPQVQGILCPKLTPPLN